MPLPTNINSYADIATVLEAVDTSGGKGTYHLPSPGKAVSWRQRAFKYRLLLQKAAAGKPTPYDTMKLTLQGSSVLIDLVPPVEGTLSLPGLGKVKPEIKREEPKPPPVDAGPPSSLDILALQLIKEKGDDNNS